jgi:hypothetical protein
MEFHLHASNERRINVLSIGGPRVAGECYLPYSDSSPLFSPAPAVQSAHRRLRFYLPEYTDSKTDPEDTTGCNVCASNLGRDVHVSV